MSPHAKAPKAGLLQTLPPVALATLLMSLGPLAAHGADPVQVEVSFDWVDGAPAELTSPLTLVAEPEPAGQESARSWELDRLPALIDLDARSWYLWAEAPGYWGEELWVERPAASPSVRLRMFPTGGVAGAVGSSDFDEAVEIEFDLDVPSATGSVVGGFAECPVEKGRWRCELPAGRLDLTIRSGLFIPQRRTGVRVAVGETREIGDLDLRLGGAVTGRVELDDGGSPSAACRVRLHGVERSGGRQASGEASPAPEEAACEDGWFELLGVPAGTWRVGAEQVGYLPAESRPIAITAGTTSELPEALRLSLPVRLDLLFEPQVDPHGEPWSFTLARVETGQEGRASSERAGEDGRWAGEGLEPGSYLLRPAGGIEPSWFEQSILLEPGGSVVVVESPLVAVEGYLNLGDEPLAARLKFGASRDAKENINLASDETGYLTGLLPRGGVWPVAVEAPAEGVSLQIEELDVVSDGFGQASIQIDLPGTRLEGQVRDHLGQPVAGATVRVRGRSSQRPRQIVTDAEGRFLVRGLPAEPVSVRAEAPGARPTTWFEVSLEEDSAAAPLQLLLIPRRP